MLTSPVNVAIALNGAPLKPQTALSDPHARKEQPPLAHPAPVPADTVIEPELPSNSPLTNVNAVAATAGNRTILQELSLNVALMLKIARRPDESLTALFLRIIIAIEKMPQAERLQFEVRSGLKGMKITLADLSAALRKPDGPEAARLTAMAEAPSAIPGRTAVSAATTTYLQEGTANGHAEETLAMRAAARSSAAGQNVFSAETRARPAETQTGGGQVLQNQLKTLFETGETPRSPTASAETSGKPAEAAPASGDRTAQTETAGDDHMAKAGTASAVEIDTDHRSAPNAASEKVAISPSNLRLDPQSLAKIRSTAQAIADALPQPVRSDNDATLPERVEPGERRPSMLTLKGLVEVVASLPAKAAEILASIPAESPVPAAETARVAPETTGSGFVLVEEELPELATMEEQPSEQAASLDASQEAPIETRADDVTAVPVRADARAGAEKGLPAAEAETRTPPRLDLAQHAVPFAHAPLPPARDEMADSVIEEDARSDREGEEQDDDDADREQRRPRDEYDEIHDPVPEEGPVLVINRDSSESDRAFALYQRMGGF